MPILAAIFAFNLGSGAWSAVVAGRLTQGGAGTAVLGVLYAVCEISRLPAALLLPAVTLRLGARRVTQAGLLVLLAVAAHRPDRARQRPGDADFRADRLAGHGRVRWHAGAGDRCFARGPRWMGTRLAGYGRRSGRRSGPVDRRTAGGFVRPGAVLVLFAAGSALMLPVATFGKLPPRTAWTGWTVLAGRGLPWLALAALGLASAADAGRAALVPSELVHQGQPLAGAGMLLTAGCAVAGLGFLVFGRMADRLSAQHVVGAGVMILVAGSFASALAVGWAPAFVLASSVLGMGASGTRLGAELALIRWLGRDRTAVAAALGETTVLGGRALGAPAAGGLGDAFGGAYAFGAIGLAALLASGVLLAMAAIKLRPKFGAKLEYKPAVGTWERSTRQVFWQSRLRALPRATRPGPR